MVLAQSIRSLLRPCSSLRATTATAAAFNRLSSIPFRSFGRRKYYEEELENLTKSALDLHNRIQSLSRAGDLDEASSVAKSSVGEDLLVFTCNAIIGSMYRADRYSDAISLFDYFFNERKLDPNRASLNLLIASHCENKEVHKALEIYQFMKNTPPFTPSAVTYGHLTKGLVDAGHIDEAVHLLRNMLGDGLAADSHVFNNIISGFLGLDNVEKADEYFDELKRGCKVYDGIIDATYMEYFLSKGNPREAMKYYKSFTAKEFKKVPLTTCNVFLELLLKWDKKEEAKALKWDMKEEAMSLYKNMLDKHAPPFLQGVNSDTINIMVDECFRAGKGS